MTRSLVRALSSVAASAVLAGAVLLVGGAGASALDAGPLAKVVNGNVQASVSGSNSDTVAVTAPAPCDASATRHSVIITTVVTTNPADQGAADSWRGKRLYSPSEVGLPGPITDYPSNGSWQQIADAFGLQLWPGTYSFTLRCQNNLGNVIFEEWAGGVTFTSRTSWTGFVGTGGPTPTPTPTPTTPAPTPTTPAPTPTPVPPSATPAPTTPPIVLPGDTTAPVARIVRLGSATLRTSAVALWSAADAGGVSSYDVRLRSARWNKPFGGYSFPASLQKTTSVTLALPLSAGMETCLSVRARDLAGNLSGWSPDRCSARPLDDRALVAQGDWVKSKSKTAYSRTLRTAKVRGATLTRSGALVGRVALVASKGKGYGKVGVLYNGKLVATVNLGAKKPTTQVVVSLPRLTRPGTVTLKVLTSGKPVPVDGLLIAAV